MPATDVGLEPAPPSSASPRIWIKIVRLAVLALLLIVVLGLFLESIQYLRGGLGEYLRTGFTYTIAIFFRPIPNRPALSEYDDYTWNNLTREITEAEQKSPATAPSLTLRISGSDGGLNCEYLVTGSAAFINELVRTGSYRTDALVQQMLGAVVVNGDSVRFHELSSEISGPEKPAVLHIRAAGIRGDVLEIELASPPKTRHLQFANKQIEVTAESAQASGDLETQSNSGESSRYKFLSTVSGRPGHAWLMIDLTGGTRPKDEPLARLMERSGLLNLPVLGQLAEALLASVPYLLLLIMVCRYLPSEEALLYRTFVGFVLALRFGVSFLASMKTGPFELAQGASWMTNLVRRTTGITGEVYPPYSVTWLLITLFAGWLWPLLVARSRKTGMQEMCLPVSRSKVGLALAAIVTVSAVVLWILVLRVAPEMPQFLRAICLLAIVAVLLFWLLWELFPGGQAFLLSIAGAITIAVLSIIGDLPNYLASTQAYRILLRGVAAAIVLVFGAPLVIAFLHVALRLIRSDTLDRVFRRRWLRWSFAVVITVPTTWLIDASQIWSGAVWQLVYNIGNFFLFVLMIVLLRILREADASSSWPRLTDLEIATGIVLALTSFYSSTSIWFFFPIPLILGYVLLKWFLFVPPMEPTPSAAVRERWKTIAANALDFHRTERTDAIARKGLEKKLAKGEITWVEYQDRLGPVVRALEIERRTSRVDGQPPDPLLFSYGTTSSEWDSGRTGAIYSLFFALPWILLSLRDVLNSHMGGSYVLLSFLGSALMIVSRWTLYGFFFGYFYAYIRGRNGFQKALSFWFTLVLPSVLASLLSSSLNKASVAALVFWTAQVFLHCLLLGLFAGELQALWKADLSWRDLLAFHNLTSLSAWGSSVVIGLGTAVTAALSTGLQTLIFQGLKYVGALPQGTVPGK